jgi:hypothetical protein
MQEIDDFLAKLAGGSNLESLENLEHAENMIRNGATIKDAVRYMKGKGHGNIGLRPHEGVVVQFDLKIFRNSNNIAQALPVPLFGILELERSYRNVLTPLLTGGTVITSVVNTDGSLVITYTNGSNTDTVTITCAQNSYASVIRATLMNKIDIKALKLVVPTDDYITEFDQPLQWTVRSMFGKIKSQDTVTPTSLIDIDQQIKRIVDIGKPTDPNAHFLTVDSETTFFVTLNQNLPSYAISIFCNDFVNLGTGR